MSVVIVNKLLCLLSANALFPLQIYLSGTRYYDRTFNDSRNETRNGLTCGVCSNPPSCNESSAQADQCIMCTVPGLTPATNYTVSVAALSDAGTGASSEERTVQTMVYSKFLHVDPNDQYRALVFVYALIVTCMGGSKGF